MVLPSAKEDPGGGAHCRSRGPVGARVAQPRTPLEGPSRSESPRDRPRPAETTSLLTCRLLPTLLPRAFQAYTPAVNSPPLFPRETTFSPPLAAGVLGALSLALFSSHCDVFPWAASYLPHSAITPGSNDATPLWPSEIARFPWKLNRFQWCSTYTKPAHYLPRNLSFPSLFSISVNDSPSSQQHNSESRSTVLSAQTRGNSLAPSLKASSISRAPCPRLRQVHLASQGLSDPAVSTFPATLVHASDVRRGADGKQAGAPGLLSPRF